MNPDLIFLPVLVQILLTFVMFIRLSVVKARASQRGEVDESRRALHGDAWPDYVQQVSNNISNQFETPVLFYALATVLWAIKAVDVYALVLAWGYVLTRLVHAWIHTGSNYVPIRRRVFTVGCILLMLLTALAFRAFI